MRREDALARLLGGLDEELCVVYLGYACREVHRHADRAENFYMLASMGLASSFALGVALRTDRGVVGIQGDGSLLMNLGALATLSRYGPDNLALAVVDNGTYAATGDQPTLARDVPLEDLVRAAGLEARVVSELDEVQETTAWTLGPGVRVQVLKCEPGNAELPFVPIPPERIRERFAQAI